MTIVESVIFCVGLALVGMNAAVIYRFWPELWLTIKLAAVTGLIIYVTLSAALGEPSAWRLWLGLAAILGDAYALFVLARAMHGAHAGDGVLIAYRRR